jgi:hypothetical protein
LPKIESLPALKKEDFKYHTQQTQQTAYTSTYFKKYTTK